MEKKILKKLEIAKYKVLSTTLAGLALFSVGCSKVKNHEVVDIVVPKKTIETVKPKNEVKTESYTIELYEPTEEVAIEKNADEDNSSSIDYQHYIDNYINKMSKQFPDADFSYFYEKVKTLKFIENNSLDERKMYAYYDKNSNTIYIDVDTDFELVLYHEFNHIMGFKYDYELSDEEFDGMFLDEGINRVICAEVFGEDETDLCKQKVLALDSIIPVETMIDYYINGSVSDIKDALKDVDNSNDSIDEYIELLDDLYYFVYYNDYDSYDETLLLDIQNKEINYFFNAMSRKNYNENNYHEALLKIGEFYHLLIAYLKTDLTSLLSKACGETFNSRLDEYLYLLSESTGISKSDLFDVCDTYILDSSLTQIALNKRYLSEGTNDYNEMEKEYVSGNMKRG